jgi:hypothetical protein
VDAVSSEEILDVPAGSSISEAGVLQAFERRRRQVCEPMAYDGPTLAVGYDQLQFSAALVAVRPVKINATLVNERESRAQFEFRAVYGDAQPPSDSRRPATDQVLASAIGWTLIPARLH